MKSTSKMFKAVLGWLIGLMVMAVTGQALAQGTWTTKAPMPTSRWASTVGVINGEIIVAGGYNGSHITTVETYDTLTNTWAPKNFRPSPQTNAANGVISGVLYAAGGTNCCVEISDLWAYDPTSDTWTPKAPLPAVRQAAGGGVINGQLHVVGGHAFGGILSSHDVYDPGANTWATKASMPTARSLLGVGVVNGILYAVGGRTILSDLTSALATVEAYDPLTDTWATKASMPTARSDVRVEVVNGILYAVGGTNASGGLSTVEAYDPVTDTWTTVASMPTARFSLGVGVVNGVLYAIGGVGASGLPPGLTTNEVFSPPFSLNIFPPSGSLATTFGFDLGFIVDAPGLSVTGGTATLDAVDKSALLASCLAPGTLISGGQTFRCPNLSGAFLGVGTHTLSVTLNLSNASSVSRTVTWKVLENTEP